jgi:hypothetical protein
LVGARGSVRERAASVYRPLALSLLIGSVIGAWWWIRNVIVYGQVQTSGLGKLSVADRQLLLGPDQPGGTELGLFTHFFQFLALRLWGSLGLADIPSIPHVFLFLLTGGFALIALVGVTHRSRFSGWTPGRGAVLCLPLVLTIAVMYSGTRAVYLRGQQLPGIQSRYLTPEMLGVAICIAAGIGRLVNWRTRWLPALALTAMLGYLSISVLVVLEIEMSPATPDGFVARLKGGIRFIAGWAPWPAWISATFAVMAGAAAFAALVLFWTEAIRSRGMPPLAKPSWRRTIVEPDSEAVVTAAR